MRIAFDIDSIGSGGRTHITRHFWWTLGGCEGGGRSGGGQAIIIIMMCQRIYEFYMGAGRSAGAYDYVDYNVRL